MRTVGKLTVKGLDLSGHVLSLRKCTTANRFMGSANSVNCLHLEAASGTTQKDMAVSSNNLGRSFNS